MKNKTKIFFLFLACLTLMGCPPHHIYDYEYTGQKSKGKEHRFEKLSLDEDNDILIDCFFYYSFIGEKKKALVAKIMTEKKSNLDLQALKVKIHSSKLGELKHMELPDLPNWDSLPMRTFGRKVDIKNEKKIRQMLINDTLSISFSNGMKYQFVRKAE
ncbi:MAG: hypothetical protein ABJN95_11160 [Maribacter sp.]|uniref:hypothetical protein n=1 Tax=Maribacter sp. TaxID=1897614 RepID=UPI003296BC98